MKNIKQVLTELTVGHFVPRALHTAAYYKIFDELIVPTTAKEIANNKKLHEKSLKLLLIVLANHNIITMDIEGKFGLNEISKTLVSSSPDSFQPFVAKYFDVKHWNAIGNIHLALENNQSPFQTLYRESFYQYLENNEAAANLSNAGMASFSESEDEEVSSLYNYQKFNNICDIGGGVGSLIKKSFHKA